MLHSTITRKGQTTIPGQVRESLHMLPGDRLEYIVKSDHAIIRVQPNAKSLKGALVSKKGKHLSIGQIREAAAREFLRSKE